MLKEGRPALRFGAVRQAGLEPNEIASHVTNSLTTFVILVWLQEVCLMAN
ncbi:hypothetical protein FHR94_003491 [Halomonas cerina]|uniref:Uncharacterized protein n=1 Tax=Halomonas cerina TaxID=447424 RepID=A0A839VHP1_9GAMM|nr:hypothetical protein [Halomonas cerina]